MSSMSVSSDEALKALDNVLSSEEFAGADRLKDFLRYVVQETVEGRGDMILGKRIAQDVYGRGPQQDSATANVVRVDAGRLRRRLDAYYREEGSENRIRIHIDKGGYAPRFSITDKQDDHPSPPVEKAHVQNNRLKLLVAVTGACVLIAMAAFVFSRAEDEVATAAPALSGNAERLAERSVLFEESPATLQALNLAEEARMMLFPATQPTRLQAALILFEAAMELDPTFYGGYAGAAQASAMFGGLAPLGVKRDQMLAQARQLAEAAVELAPTAAWSQSSMAFVNLAERNFDDANRLSRRAVSLDPEDLIALEIDAIIAFFSGDFERARESAAPEKHQNREGTRFPWRNVYANASFHLQDYETAVEYMIEAAQQGGPVSEINSAYLIASLQASGKSKDASRYLAEYSATWPESRIEELLNRLFANPDHPKELIAQLVEAGWQR